MLAGNSVAKKITHTVYDTRPLDLKMSNLISAVSKLFLQSESWEYVAFQALKLIGEGLGLSRASILRNTAQTHDGLELSSSYQWSNDAPTSAHKAQFVFGEITSSMISSRWAGYLNKGKMVQRISRAKNPLAKLASEIDETEVINIIPITVKKQLWGVLVFENPLSQSNSLAEHIQLLRVLCNVFESAVEGEQASISCKQNEKRFKIVSRATKDAFYDWDLVAKQVWRSSNTDILFGTQAHQKHSDPLWWENNIHPKDRNKVMQSMSRLYKQRKGFWSAEYRFRNARGKYSYILDRAYIAYNKNGIPIRRIGSMQDITEQKNNERNLQESRDQLRRLAQRSQLIREEERKLLARELHDEFAQVLTGIKYNLDWLKQKLGGQSQQINSCIDEVSSSVLTTMDKVKQTAMSLRPNIIDDLGLSAAIKWQLEKFEARLDCDCVANVENVQLNKDVEVAMFRVFQEALSNVARHASASRVEVRLQESNQSVELQVKDNGIGVERESISDNESLGILGMRERVASMNGELDIQALLGGGTSILVKIPLDHQPEMTVKLDTSNHKIKLAGDVIMQ